jgi:hypothetical protein
MVVVISKGIVQVLTHVTNDETWGARASAGRVFGRLEARAPRIFWEEEGL